MLNPTTTFINLPMEINKKICDQVSINDLLILASTSKSFNNFFLNNVFWIGRTIRHTLIDRINLLNISASYKQIIENSPIVDLSVGDQIQKLANTNTIKDFLIKINFCEIITHRQIHFPNTNIDNLKFLRPYFYVTDLNSIR